ncbi:hypothetical protein [Psychrobacter sp. W2-37-MNA-CIBAN-0211]|uniref:defense against restriction DarA-related protein n=1 Tax=Psychrobacter sp. W2-37-MNA-CIBAN-0211 TaxID=3140443 RepID=UPI0033245542
MAYTSLNKAHTHHSIEKGDGSNYSAYSRYETGVITGGYRDLPAVIADESGFDGLGFDSSVGSEDDQWHMVNIFKQGGRYIDSLAIGGAYDDDQAMQVATSQLDCLGGDYCNFVTESQNVQFDNLPAQAVDTWSIDAVNKLMDNPSQDQHYLPTVTAQELKTEATRVTFDDVQWDSMNKLSSHGGKDSLLSLDMTRADTRHELITPFVLTDTLIEMDAQEISFDALMDTASRLSLLKDRLYTAMWKAGASGDLTVTNVTQTKEFKRQGVINTAFIFDLSDGQTLSIWFHNPDSTPSKLLPSDIMISWKWMLNKRDVTAALSPKNGDNVQLTTLASRILRVAGKNSKRFQSAQVRNAKVSAELDEAQKDVDDKNATIEQLDTDIEGLHAAIDARMKAADTKAATPSPDEVNNNADLPAPKEDTGTPEKVSTPNGDFAVGDSVVWRNGGSEIKGTFNAYMEGTGTISFFDEGGDRTNAKDTEVFANASATGTDDKAADTTADAPAVPAKKEKKAKTYPPVEYQGKGVFIAYKNSKKKDTWSASQLDDGSWHVFADNAQTRAYNSSKPKSFKDVAAMIAQYPAFAGIEALIAQNIRTDTDTTEYNTDYTNDFDNYTTTMVKGENAGTTYTYAEIIKAPELLKTFYNSVAPFQSSRIDSVKELLTDNDWELRSEFEGDDYLDGVIKEGVEVIPTLNSNTSPEQDINDRLVVWTMESTNFKFLDDLSLSDSEVVAMIEKAYASADADDDNDDADEYDAIDSSEYPSIFLERNADNLQVLGIDDDAIQVNDRGQYAIEKGMFKDMTLVFADTVCKLVQAADDNDSQIAVADYNATAYQGSMFDALTNKSKPAYGITAQITKDGLNLRARVNEDGECDILLGTSGATVHSNVKPVFTDNTVAYKDAIQESFFKQGEIDMEAENKAKAAEPVAEPALPVEPATDDTPATSLADRIAVVMDNVTSRDFDPTSIDTDALLGMVDEAEGDAALTAEIDTLTQIYQRKLVAISMKALAGLAGDE